MTYNTDQQDEGTANMFSATSGDPLTLPRRVRPIGFAGSCTQDNRQEDDKHDCDRQQQRPIPLSDWHQKGEELLRKRDIGIFLDGVETGFILSHNRRVLDRYTFRQRCIDAVKSETHCKVLGVELSTPVIMSAITTPIPAIVENGLIEVALALKEVGSLV